MTRRYRRRRAPEPREDPRWRKPYGVYFTPGGDEVVHDRLYRPLWRRHPDGRVERADPAERVPVAFEYWFPDGRAAERLLTAWGLQ